MGVYIDIQRRAIDSIRYAYSSVYWPCYQWAYIGYVRLASVDAWQRRRRRPKTSI